MREKENERRYKGWIPDAQGGEEALTTDELSLNLGKSGQFAPGGYYNQRNINQPDRRTLDDTTEPPARH
jgi:hypothetical protein